MNYLKCYLNLVNRRLIKNPNLQTEKHHIIPVSINNTKYAINMLKKTNKDKIAYLTLREHYIAHLLLVKIFELNSNCYIKMLTAWNFMSNRSKNNSNKYLVFKTRYSKMQSDKLKNEPGRAKGKKWSNKAKQNKSKNHYLKGKTYEEAYGKEKAEKLKEIRKNAKLGIKFTEEMKKNYKIGLEKRSKNEQWKHNISKSRIGTKVSEETKQKLSKIFSNSDTNPNVDQTLYTFINIKTGEIVIKRKIDMKKEYGCTTIYLVVNGKKNQSKGWKLVK